MEHPERTSINDLRPEFGWIYNVTHNGDAQKCCQILVSSERAIAGSSKGDVWNSGKQATNRSINFEYGGPALQPGHDYFWRVRTWNDADEASPWSKTQEFHTAPTTNSPIGSLGPDRYPLVLSEVSPARLVKKGEAHWFIDFGKDAFGFLRLKLNGSFPVTQMEVRFGEMADDDSVVTRPGAKIRYSSTNAEIHPGQPCEIHPPKFSGTAIEVPASIGAVLPFRYVELINCPAELTKNSIQQAFLHYEFNDAAASFNSSDTMLNQVWELCKYSIKATSFAGVYVDGDRERKPYEADAYLNQLSQYSLDREYTLARYSQEYLLANPTWPTEWKFHSVMIAGTDFLWTGDTEPLAANYTNLQGKILDQRARPDGLLDTRGMRDIVDWPVGERDGFVFKDVNTVVNAYYYRSLRILADIAGALGRPQDAANYTARAEKAYSAFNKVLWDPANGCYVDGENANHASVHANLFPLAFGLVPDDRKASVTTFLKTKGMACSVYGSQFLLEGLYAAGEGDYALSLLTATNSRSWYNMLAVGSTITLEAWDKQYKNNLDWNHAWGAAPANIIPRYILGVQPLEPGFGKILIQPQVGHLSFAEGTVPTIRGPVSVRIDRDAHHIKLRATIPGNVAARVSILLPGPGSLKLSLDGVTVPGKTEGSFVYIDGVMSGLHNIEAVWQ